MNKRTFLIMSMLTVTLVISALIYITSSADPQSPVPSVISPVIQPRATNGHASGIPGTQHMDVLLSRRETAMFTRWVSSIEDRSDDVGGRSIDVCLRNHAIGVISSARLCVLLARYYRVQLEDVIREINHFEMRWPYSQLAHQHTCLLFRHNVQAQLKLTWYDFNAVPCLKIR